MRIGRMGYGRNIAAICVALAAVAISATPAQAAKKIKDKESEVAMADAFRSTANAAKSALASGDMSTANSQIVGLQPTNALEKYVTASLKFQYAERRNDPQAIRRALTDMLESGAAPEAQIPYLRYLAGYYSYYLGEHNDAIAQVNYARQLGYSPVETTIILADANIKKKKQAEGL